MNRFGRFLNTCIAIAMMVSCFATVVKGWCLPNIVQQPGIYPSSKQRSLPLCFAAPTDGSSADVCQPQAVSEMRLSEIKAELKERNIDFSDCFDKESMVLKLTEARSNNIDNSEPKKSNDESSGTSSSSASPTAFDREAALEELKGMRVRELREELGKNIVF